MGDDARPGLARLLDGQLDAQVTALVAVVHGGHRPRCLGALRIARRVVVEAVVGQLLHASLRSLRICPRITRADPQRSRLSGPAVGAEGPDVAFGVTDGEAAGAVVLVLDGEDELGA